MRSLRTRALFGCAALVALALSLPAFASAEPVPLAQIGSEGTGAGQLEFPHALVVAPSGDLYVADRDNNRISVFSPTGTFIHAFGVGVATGSSTFEVCTTTCQAGLGDTGAGDMSQPEGVALDGSGNLYVSDSNGHRIDVYGTTGTPTFIRAFGAGVDTGADAFQFCTTASGCQGGTGTAVAGAMQYPTGVALDDSGHLYVSDANNHRIDVFNTAGPSFVDAFGAGVATAGHGFEVCTTVPGCEAGEPTAVAGALKFPQGLALDGGGNLHVSEYGNNRISTFDTTGPTFVRAFGFNVAAGGTFESCTATCQIGQAGADSGKLYAPTGIALDSSGALHVTDFFERVSTFDPTTPSFTRAFGWDVAAPDGSNAFEICPTDGACQGGDSGSSPGQFASPHGVAADCQGAIWVADAGNSRLQRFGEPATPLCQPSPPPPAGGGGGDTTSPSATLPSAIPIAPMTKCKKGFVKKKVKGKKKCVKKKKK
jgi:DNA-binding beta-propeller fold protein YncE